MNEDEQRSEKLIYLMFDFLQHLVLLMEVVFVQVLTVNSIYVCCEPTIHLLTPPCFMPMMPLFMWK